MRIGNLVRSCVLYRKGEFGVIIKTHLPDELRGGITHSVLFWDETIERLSPICFEVLL